MDATSLNSKFDTGGLANSFRQSTAFAYAFKYTQKEKTQNSAPVITKREEKQEIATQTCDTLITTIGFDSKDKTIRDFFTHLATQNSQNKVANAIKADPMQTALNNYITIVFEPKIRENTAEL